MDDKHNKPLEPPSLDSIEGGLFDAVFGSTRRFWPCCEQPTWTTTSWTSPLSGSSS